VNVFFAIIFGMAFGSFATMAQYRLPRNKPWSSISVMKGEKIHCPNCQHVLKFRDWCPVVGFIKNKGKCKFCSTPISRYYLFTEFGITFFSVLNVLLYGFEQQYAPMTLFASAAVVMVVTELKYHSIPEKLTVGMLFAALMHRMLLTQDINMILISSVAGVMVAMALAKLYQKLIKSPLALEYSKLLALAGVALPLSLLPIFMALVILLGGMAFLFWKNEERVPYAIPILIAELLLMYYPPL
jgi:prepilin signal peptidase PulO-like enzyme (type II secretory pathway)